MDARPFGPVKRCLAGTFGAVVEDEVEEVPRVTLENNGKIWLQPDGENAFAGASGGADGIRNVGTCQATWRVGVWLFLAGAEAAF